MPQPDGAVSDNETRRDETGNGSNLVPARDVITGGFSKKADLISYVLTGLLIGVVLDWALGTRPVMIIILSIAAIVIGYWRLWQASAELEEEAKDRGHGV